MGFLDGLGLGGGDSNDNEKNSPQALDQEMNLDEEQENDDGNEL